jgi:hypothetical protein
MRHPAIHPFPRRRALALAAAALGVLSTLALAAPPAAAVTLDEHFEHTYPLTGGGTLEIRNTNGSVVVEAWDRNEVRVLADKRVKASGDDEARRTMGLLKIEVSQGAGSLRIDTKYPETHGLMSWLFGGGIQTQVEYRLQVPRRLALVAHTVNGGVHLTGTQGSSRLETTNGTLQVASTAGPLELSTTNGNIEVRQSAGAVRAESTNGSVEVALTRIDGRVGLETTNGSVTVHLPRDVRANVDAGTTNGSVKAELPVAATSTGRRHLQGAINGGGPELRLSTTNGSVRILSL